MTLRVKYYIDGVLQNYIPSLPDPNTEIVLANTAIIGYPDEIQSRGADFKVWKNIQIPE